MKSLHDEMGHQGKDRTLSLVSSRFYWPGMATHVDKLVTHCDRCIRFKHTKEDKGPSG